MADSAATPWYRHFWVWFLMIPPAAAVIGGFITAFLAGGPPSLVVDDYGQIAMATEARAARDAAAAELGLSAELFFEAIDGDGMQQLRVRLNGHGSAPVPTRIRARLIHPTIETLDRMASLQRRASQYVGSIERPDGRYYIQIEDDGETWRLTGVLYGQDDQLTLVADQRVIE